MAVSLLGHPGVLPQKERHGGTGGLSLDSGQTSEESCQITSTTAFDHRKLELSKAMIDSRPTGSNVLTSRKLGNSIPAISIL